jgi:protein phosphatase
LTGARADVSRVEASFGGHHYAVACASEPAADRGADEESEDAEKVDLTQGVVAVADGVSGRPGGAQAAAAAVAAFAREARAPDGLAEAVRRANQQVRSVSRLDPELAGAASTLSAVVLGLDGAPATVVHLGDGRVYLYRRGELRRLTRDHTVAAELVALDRLSPEAALHHPLRNALARYLGGDDAEADLAPLPLEEGDVLLLTTDGLPKVVSEAEIEAYLAEARAPERLVGRLLAAAIDRHPEDDVTVLALRVGEEA